MITKVVSTIRQPAIILPFLIVTMAAFALNSPWPYAAWLGYSAMFAWLAGTRLAGVLKDDAKTYAAAALLFFLPLTALVKVPQEFERFAYLPGALLVTVSVSFFVALKVYFLAKFRDRIAARLPRNVGERSSKIALVLAAAYAIGLAAMSIAKHHAFNTRGFDLGIFDQTLWGLAHGKVIFSTVVGDYLFAHHSFFLFFPLSLLYKVAPKVELLLALQCLVMAAGVLPLFKLAKSKLGGKAALVVAVAYLIYPAMNYITLEDFHIESFAVTTILFGLYFLERKKEMLFFLMAVLTALIKEDAAIAGVALGLYALVIKRRWKIGMAAAVISSAIFLFATELFIPYFSEAGTFSVSGFGALGSTPLEVVKNALLNPIGTLSAIASPERLAYLAMMLLPTGGLSLLAPELLVWALPAFSINMLSEAPQLHSIFFHYNANIIPFIFLALIAGLSRARKMLEAHQLKWGITALQANAAIMALVLSASVFSAYYYGPLPGARNFSYSSYDFNSGDAKAARELSAMIPSNASVSASNTAVPHLSQRELIYVFPNPFHKAWYLTDEKKVTADYVLLSLTPSTEGIYTGEEFIGYVNELLNDEQYGIIAGKGSWLLLKSGASYGEGICKNYAEIKKESFITLELTAKNAGTLEKCDEVGQ
ncbi:MAG: DUF2079 domain-containing protein [Candidatus Woesearchaeota archaeon]